MTVGNIKELARSIPALHQRFARNPTILPFIYDGSLQASLTPAPHRPVQWETSPATVAWTAGTASPAWEAPQTSQASTSAVLVTEWLAALSLTGETQTHVSLPETKTRTTGAPWRRAYLKTPSHPEELDLVGIMREARNDFTSVSYEGRECLRVFSPVPSSPAGEEMAGMWRVSDYDLPSGQLAFSVSLNFRTGRVAPGWRRREAGPTGMYHHSPALRGEGKRKTCSEGSNGTSSEHFHPSQKRMCH